MKPKCPSQPQHNEVELVNKVKNCTDCSWFWGGVAPYGPFPAFDWKEKYPPAIKDGPQGDEDVVRWTEATQVKGPRVEPAVLRGCRKAPIMTVGINPNMTAFFAGANSSTWAYPYFENEETYAYYYRHAKIHQESFALSELRKQIVEGSEVVAEENGTLYIERSDTHRWMQLTFEYEKAGEKYTEISEYGWHPDERLVIFAQNNPNTDTFLVRRCAKDDGQKFSLVSENKDVLLGSDLHENSEKYVGMKLTGIRKGDLIAAKIYAMTQDHFEIFANRVGYYERALPILNTFNEYLHSKGFLNCKLEIAEDISMHDMVACASPGWNKGRYGIPVDTLAHKCVDQNQYMFDQLAQSKPRVVLIVSKSSLNMFAPAFTKSFGGTLELDESRYSKKNAFELLKDTCENRYTLSWGEGEAFFESRVIVTPHFSYGSNFKAQCRFSTKESWHSFKTLFPKDLEILQADKRIEEQNDESSAIIFVEVDDAIRNKLSSACWELLMQRHLEPYTLIQKALSDEHERCPFIGDSESIHLDRAPGNCTYCVNQKWQFPEGCEYGLGS